MRYSKQISTGLIIESQSCGDVNNPEHLQSLRNNAEQHYPSNDIEVGYCTDAELKAMLEAREIAKDLADPLGKWQREMQATDSSMPRWFEDYIAENSVTLAPGRAKDSYDAKVALRAGRPV